MKEQQFKANFERLWAAKGRTNTPDNTERAWQESLENGRTWRFDLGLALVFVGLIILTLVAAL